MSCQLFDLDALHAGKYFVHFLSKSLQENYQSVKMVWVQIRTDILWVLIWVQAVCIGS